MHRTAVAAVLSLLGCSPGNGPPASAALEPLWPEANALFESDASWVGGDGAYSIDLGGERVLWLFGDSWIDTSARGTRQDATMVSNSVAIQYGYDPARSTIDFYWKTSRQGRPEAFFGDREGRRFWPGHGAMVGNQLLLFLMEVRNTGTGLGFEIAGWQAVRIGNPGAPPAEWQTEFVDSPANPRRIIVGSGGVLVADEFLYAYGSQEPDAPHPVFLVRWPLEDAKEGSLRAGMQWWAGADVGWLPGEEGALRAAAVLEDGQTEFTVHRDPISGRFRLTQTEGFGPAVVVARSAVELTGPWSPPDTLLSPPETAFPNILIYQGKAHPHLRGKGLIVTYCTNSTDFSDQLRYGWLYYPRFARLEGR